MTGETDTPCRFTICKLCPSSDACRYYGCRAQNAQARERIEAEEREVTRMRQSHRPARWCGEPSEREIWLRGGSNG